jgi:hypothetical protein
MVCSALLAQSGTGTSSLRNEPNFWESDGLFLVFCHNKFIETSHSLISQFFRKASCSIPKKEQNLQSVYGFSPSFELFDFSHDVDVNKSSSIPRKESSRCSELEKKLMELDRFSAKNAGLKGTRIML